MARSAWWFLAALALALGACGGGRKRPAPPESSLFIWAPGVVRWEGDDRSVAFVLENGTSHAVTVPPPDPRRARVAIYPEDDDRPVCQSGPAETPGGDPVSLAPGDQLPVRVDLSAACPPLAAGEYRVEIGYEPPKGGPGETVAPRPRSGVLVVAARGR